MTRLLAIDTSSPQTLWCGIEDGDAVDPVLAEGTNKHDTVLADGVRTWLDSHHGWRKLLDGIAVVIGPGGFTGLRVGVAFASGLAEALDLPIVPVLTSRLLAARVDDCLVWAIYRAGGKRVKGQVVSGGLEFATYGEIVEFAPLESVPVPSVSWESRTEHSSSNIKQDASSGSATDAPTPLENSAEPGNTGPLLLPLGEGYTLFREPIDAALGARLRQVPALRSLPDALALTATRVFNDNGTVSPLDVDVVYGSEFRPTPKPGS